jgi:hypothetical protein
MISDVRSQLNKIPFLPFSIRTSDGHEYPVPTVDHVFVTPRGNRVVVVTDDDSVAILGPLHIAGVIQRENET